MAAELAVTESEFKTKVLESDLPVLVDFWATWCPPCVKIAPDIEQMAADYTGKAKVFKLDVDQAGGIAREYGIMSIPALLIFKGGQEVDRMVGAGNKEQLRKFLDAHV